jgi:hypothetical protein
MPQLGKTEKGIRNLFPYWQERPSMNKRGFSRQAEKQFPEKGS